MDIHIASDRTDVDYLPTLACSHVREYGLRNADDGESVRIINVLGDVYRNIEKCTYSDTIIDFN